MYITYLLISFRHCVSNYGDYMLFINLLLPEASFPSNIKIYSKIASYRLPTHRHSAHRRIFFHDLFFFKRNFGNAVDISNLWHYCVDKLPGDSICSLYPKGIYGYNRL